jgi:hypothetical protein
LAKQCGLVSWGQNGQLFSMEILRERPIKYYKCPTFDTKPKRRRFLDFCLALQNRTNEQKMQLSLTERSDLNIRCYQMTQKQLFHSLFLGWMYIQKNQIPSGSHVALSEPVAIKSLVF